MTLAQVIIPGQDIKNAILTGKNCILDIKNYFIISLMQEQLYIYEMNCVTSYNKSFDIID